MNLTEKAKLLGRDAHNSINQRRKYTNEPYWVHTEAVADRVASVGGSENMIAAAYLHDYIEDVIPVLRDEGRFVELAAFESRYKALPAEVHTLVTELTDVFTKDDYPRQNRAERKKLERERIAKISNDAKTIKLADLIDNTASIVEQDPGFAITYIKEKLELLPYLTEGHPALLNHASMQAANAAVKLGIPLPMLYA